MWNEKMDREINAKRAAERKVIAVALDLVNGPPGPHVSRDEAECWDRQMREDLFAALVPFQRRT